MKMTNLEIVAKMVENGYHLFNETPEHFAARFTNSQLKQFYIFFLLAKKR